MSPSEEIEGKKKIVWHFNVVCERSGKDKKLEKEKKVFHLRGLVFISKDFI